MKLTVNFLSFFNLLAISRILPHADELFYLALDALKLLFALNQSMSKGVFQSKPFP